MSFLWEDLLLATGSTNKSLKLWKKRGSQSFALITTCKDSQVALHIYSFDYYRFFLVTKLWQMVLSHTTLTISYKPEYQSLHTGPWMGSTTMQGTQNIGNDPPSLLYQVLKLLRFFGLSYLGSVTCWFFNFEKENIGNINSFLYVRTSKYPKRMKFVAVSLGIIQALKTYRLSESLHMSTAIEVSLTMLPTSSWI